MKRLPICKQEYNFFNTKQIKPVSIFFLLSLPLAPAVLINGFLR